MSNKIVVYYDGACPKCVKDRCRYEKMAGEKDAGVEWVDITGREEQLRQLGIDPQLALTELHVKDQNQRIVSELDAYILLMKRVPKLKLFAWFLGLPLIRPVLAKLYHWQVNRRLRRDGRL